MKIGLYFGSFNPIHIGHLIIANYIASNTNLDKVWLVVSPQNPLKKLAGLLNEYDRLHLVKLAIEDNSLLSSSDIEFKLPRPSYTIDTLTYLTQKYPHYAFSIIMGSDSLQNINKWKNGNLILKDYNIYVYERPGFAIDHYGNTISAIKAPLLEISSSLVRETIKNRKSIRYLVPEIVREEIENNRYFLAK